MGAAEKECQNIEWQESWSDDYLDRIGRTLPADTDITDSVIELKAQFDQIGGDAIKDPVGRANYDAVKTFFDTHLI